MSTEVVENVDHIGFERFPVSALDFHPGIFHLVPKFLDTVELGAVGRQKVERDALGFEEFEDGPDLLGLVDRCVVEDDGQRLGDMLFEQPQKAHEEISRRCLPEPGAEDFAAGEQGSQHVEALFTPLGIDQVALAHGRPGSAVGMNLGKSRFIDVGQHRLARGGLLAQDFDVYGCLPEGGLVASFFKE